MPAVSYVGAGAVTQPTTATTSDTVARPASEALNDIELLLVASGANANNTINLPSGTGWSQILQRACVGDTGAPVIAAFIRQVPDIAGGSVTLTHTSVKTTSRILAYRNVDLTTMQDCPYSFLDQQTASLTHVLPAMDIVNDGAAIVVLGSDNGVSNTATPPTGFTELQDRTVTNARDVEMAHKLNVPPGNTGTMTITWAGGGLRGVDVAIALRPIVPAVSQQAWGIPM